MKKLNVIRLLMALLLLGNFSFSLKAQKSTESKESLLWEIKGNGLKNPSYLYGTMHIIEKNYFYFPKTLEKIIKKSNAIVMEIADLDQAEAMKYFVLKEGTLFDYFTPSQQDTLIKWVTKNTGMTTDLFKSTFEKMKPFVVLQTVMQVQMLGKIESFERTISGIGEDNHIKISGLETIGEQVGIFDRLTNDQQTEMVMEAIRDEDKNKAETLKMQQLYRNQQLDSLYQMIVSSGGVISDEQNAFLNDRNANWIPKIEAIVKDKRAFIAVGAGHLAGEKGVINLLREAGYSVTPVKL